MSNRILSRLAAMAAVLAGLMATPAMAGHVSATASFVDMTLTLLSASNHQYLNDASTPDESYFNVGTEVGSVELNSTTPEATSYAALFNEFAPLPQTTASAISDGFGHASVLWTFDWTATETGMAAISLDFLTTAIVQNLLPGESALARSFASVLVDGTTLENSALHFFQSVEGVSGGIETLALTFAVVAGQTGTFTLALASDAFAAPAVPIPAALPLLGSALLGFGLARRRKAKSRENAAAAA